MNGLVSFEDSSNFHLRIFATFNGLFQYFPNKILLIKIFLRKNLLLLLVVLDLEILLLVVTVHLQYFIQIKWITN